jgi:hypothetical protein
VRGPRRFLAGAGAGALVSVLAFACGAWYFHDANVWSEWFRCAQGMNGGVLTAPFFEGNQSVSGMLARHSMSYGPMGYSLLIAVALAMAFIVAMSSMGRRGDLVLPTALKCFADPWFALSIGILFTFTTSPMVWPHYHLFALIPIFWLFRLDGRWEFKTWCAALTYVALTNPVLEFLGAAGHFSIIQSLMLLCWTPLIPGMLAYAVEQRESIQAAGSVPASK